MSLTLSLTNALSGLRAAEATLSVISSNIANVNTPGYTRKEQPLSSRVGAESAGSGVSTAVVVRKVDEFLRRDVRRQVSIEGAAVTRDEFFARMTEMLGSVSSGGVINAGVTDLQRSLSALALSPSSAALQRNVVEDARQLALNLNRIAVKLQELRKDAEKQLGDSVETINVNLAKTAELNRQITRAYALRQPVGDLEDQRDLAVKELAKEIGIQTFVRESGEMVLYTSRGRTLLDGVANYVRYSSQPAVNSGSTFAPILLGANGIDITNEISTGQLAALKDARDNTLPALDKQVNLFARALYELSWAPPATPSTAAAPNEVKVYGVFDNSAAAPAAVTVKYEGDFQFYDSDGVAYNAEVAYSRVAGGPPYSWEARLTALTRARDGNAPTLALPLSLGTLAIPAGGFATPPGGPPAPAAGTAVTVTLAHGTALPSQIHLRFSADASQITAAARATALSPQNDRYRLFGNIALNNPAATNGKDIKVNSFFDNEQFHTDGRPGEPGRLFVSGDNIPSVSQRMLTKFTETFSTAYNATAAYHPVTNTPVYSEIGATLAPGNYTLSTLANAIVSNNATMAKDASSNAKYQKEYVIQLETRTSEIDGVSTDEEMQQMVVYQKAYAASARVMDVTSKMFDVLLSIGA